MAAKMRRGGKIAAYGSYHSPSNTSGNVTSSTINTMLQELQQLIKKTQVSCTHTQHCLVISLCSSQT